MASSKKQKEFLVTAKLTIDTNRAVLADDLAEAVEKSKNLVITDFVDILGDHNDSTVEITGAFVFVAEG
jgi:hypothetical protein